MKTFSLTFVILFIAFLFSTYSFAQLQKGTWLLDGHIGAQTTLNDDNKDYAFGIYPSAGYAFSNRWLAGTSIGTGSSFSKGEDLRLESNSIFLSPFIRYYFAKPARLFKPFINVRLDMNFQKLTFSQPFFEEIRSDNYHLVITTGFNYFAKPSLAVEGRVGYIGSYNQGKPTHSAGYTMELKFFLPAAKEMNTDILVIQKNTYLIDLLATGGWYGIGGSDDFFAELNSTLGYFINNRTVLGTNLLYAFANENSIINVEPFARYYFGTSNRSLQPFATAGFGTRFQFDDTFSESSFFNLNVTGGIGADLFLTPNVALEGLLSYDSRQIEDFNTKVDFLSFNIGLQFFLASSSAQPKG